MAYYPTEVKTFQNKVNLQSVVMAEDVNYVYDEITAMQTVLGTGIQLSKWSGTFTTPTTNWPSLQARLENIEIGIYKANQGGVSISGNSVIIPESASVTGLTIKGYASQTANLLELKSADGVIRGSIGFSDVTNTTLVLNKLTIDGGNA